MRQMSQRVAFLFSAVLFIGCYSPQLGIGPGFYCHPGDDPACPDGQSCVNGRCVSDNGGGGGGRDSGSSGGGDLANTAPPDLSMSEQPDLSMPQDNPDFSTGSACVCSSSCLFGCVGPDCCEEDVIFGACMASTTCTPS